MSPTDPTTGAVIDVTDPPGFAPALGPHRVGLPSRREVPQSLDKAGGGIGLSARTSKAPDVRAVAWLPSPTNVTEVAAAAACNVAEAIVPQYPLTAYPLAPAAGAHDTVTSAPCCTALTPSGPTGP